MKKLFLCLMAAVPTMLFAHAGHGVFEGSTLLHYLNSPAHVISFIGAITLFAILIKRKKTVVKTAK